MYENRHARFTAVDPLLASGKSANPQTFNRYVYVLNSPLVFTDPTGLQTAQRFCTECTPAFSPEGKLRVFRSGETVEEGYTPITTTMRFDGQSGRIYWLTPTSSEQYIDQDQPNSTIAPLSNGVVEGVNDAETGAWRGLKNLGIGLVNFSTQPGGVQGSLIGIPNPFAISPYPYENLRQARFGTGVEIGLPTGLGVGAGFFSGTSTLSVVPRSTTPSFVSAEARAVELQGLLDEFSQTKRTTAVLDGVGIDGNFVRLVSSSRDRVAPVQRKAFVPGEIEATGVGHAEVTALRVAQNLGIRPVRIGVSRWICPSCQRPIVESGSVPSTPFRFVRRPNEK